METKPFSLQSPEQIAKDYGGNKQKIAEAMQMGLVDPTAGTLAGMFIDRMRSAQMLEQAPQATVAQQVMGGLPVAPQAAPPQSSGGLGATPQAGPPMAPQMPPPPEAVDVPMPSDEMPEMAAGGLTTLPVPDTMFDEPDNGGYATGGLVAFAQGGMSRLYDDVEYWESGGKQGAVSPKGARGVMQLMPGTMRDPGFGVKPMQADTEEENRRVGREYLDAMYRRYGNEATALAAYNWGPGNVDKWLKAGGDPNKLPAETRKYISSVMGDKVGGVANTTSPMDLPGGSLADEMMPAFERAGEFYDKFMPKPKTEVREKVKARLEERMSEETQKKEKDYDKWSTLAEIGFNIAGSNAPNLLQAVGAAAAAALPGARQAKKEREARYDAALERYAELEGIENAEARERVKFMLDFGKTELDLKDKDLTRGTNWAVQKMEDETQRFNITENVKLGERGQNLDYYAALQRNKTQTASDVAAARRAAFELAHQELSQNPKYREETDQAVKDAMVRDLAQRKFDQYISLDRGAGAGGAPASGEKFKVLGPEQG